MGNMEKIPLQMRARCTCDVCARVGSATGTGWTCADEVEEDEGEGHEHEVEQVGQRDGRGVSDGAVHSLLDAINHVQLLPRHEPDTLPWHDVGDEGRRLGRGPRSTSQAPHAPAPTGTPLP